MTASVLYFDCFSGISGDMVLGALVDAGVPLDFLQACVATLPVELSASKVLRGGIRATRVEVKAADQAQHRTWAEIRQLLRELPISPAVQERAERTFELLAKAEAEIHGLPADEVHFHEVGALDSIVDIVCSAAGIEELNVQEVLCSPVSLGRGWVQSQHGRLPVPAPATALLLEGFYVRQAPVEGELTTPTGAAILAAQATPVPELPVMKLRKVGLGAGKRELREQPNVLRILIGEKAEAVEYDTVALLECQIDDTTPEILAYAAEILFERGALDVWFTPATMKKGRPGTEMHVLCPPERTEDCTSTLFLETSTIGVRRREVQRIKLPRRIVEVQTCFGTVKAKEVEIGGRKVRVPEFEECKRIAKSRNLPLAHVYETLRAELNLKS